MKLYKSMILGAALALSATSCNDWLDINTPLLFLLRQ